MKNVTNQDSISKLPLTANAAIASHTSPGDPVDKFRQTLLEAARTIENDGLTENVERFERFRGSSEGEWREVQVLDSYTKPNGDRVYGRPLCCFAHVSTVVDEVRGFRQGDEGLNGVGTYVIMNKIDPAIRARGVVNEWNVLAQGCGTKDGDIVSRIAVYFDFDPKRPSGISGTEEEKRLAFDAAVRCYGDLAAELGTDAFMGFGFSGNGLQVFLALDDLPNDKDTAVLVKAVILAASYIFSTDKVEVDVSVSDAKRLCPAFGTVKRKGVDDPERPHRKTWFWCQEKVLRLGLGDLEGLCDSLKSRLTPDQVTEVEKVLGIKPAAATPSKGTSGPPTTTASPGPGSTGTFSQANNLPVQEVAGWLGLVQDGRPVCAGCGTTGDSSVAFVGNGIKCLHNRCARKGKNGFRTVVDLVCEVRGVKPLDAVKELAGQFDLGQVVFANIANIARPSAACAAWDEPVEIQEGSSLVPFPTWALPPWLRDWAESEAEATQTPVDLPAMLGMTVLASCLAKKYEVEVRSGWVEPLNLYSVTALPSGNRKSPVYRDATKPLQEFERDLEQQAVAGIERSKAQQAILKSRLNQTIRAAVDNPGDTKAAEALAEEIARRKIPEPPRLVVDDVTTEKLAVVMSEQGGRIAMFSSEGGIFETMAGRYSESANIDLYLKAHAGDDARVDRVSRASIHLRSPALTLGLTVQPDVVQGLVQKPGFRGHGLLARLLYSLPVSRLGKRDVSPPPVPDAIKKDYYEAVQRLLREPANQLETGEILPRKVILASGAEQWLTLLMSEIEPQMGPGGDLAFLNDWAGKLAGTVARIAALLHLAESTGDLHLDLDIPSDRPSIMERAIAIGYYLLEHAKAAFRHMAADPALGNAKYVLDVLKKDGGQSITRRDLFEKTKGRFGRVDELEHVLALLEERHYVRQVERQPQGPGRPSVVIEVNPRWASQYSQNSQNPPVVAAPASSGAGPSACRRVRGPVNGVFE